MARRAEKARTRPDLRDPITLGGARACDAPGCDAVGEHRAPRDRSRLRDYYWFCLEHVREYNAAWDYYRGMDPGEIEQHLREDVGWQRPTWPLGRLGNANLNAEELLSDPLGALNGAPKPAPRRKRTDEAPPELRAALGVLGLGWPVEHDELRARYKELAKRYHPDSNGGDRSAEDRFKDINRAYSLLRARLAPRPRAAAPASSTATPASSAVAPETAAAG